MSTLAFTICTNSYIPYAVTLANSYKINNPGNDFILVLLDDIEESNLDYFNKFNILYIPIKDLNIHEFDEMQKSYNAFEMSCAAKPFVSIKLLEYYDHKNLIYFDSDILVFDKILIEENTDFSIAITPHCISAIDLSIANHIEQSILKYGIYNAGFFIINSQHSETMIILKWWCKKLKSQCIIDLEKGLFVDQLWLNFFPVYFNSIRTLKTIGFNVAIWNIHEREVSFKIDQSTSNLQKCNLIFFHFTGFKYSKYKTDNLLSDTHKTIPVNSDILNIYKYYSYQLELHDISTFTAKKNYFKPINTSLHKNNLFKYFKKLKFVK